eukprot:6199856-Pleurochrysis_carterae.AAC.6
MQIVGAGEQAQARGLGGAWAVARGGGSMGSGGHHEQVSKSLGSGVRALREYACDANANWETMHVNIKLQMKGARDDSL